MTDEIDGIHELIIGHRRYFAAKVGDVEVSVRIPLQVFGTHDENMLAPYAEDLARKVLAEKRRQGMMGPRQPVRMTLNVD